MKIVIDQPGIVVVDGGNGIEQRRHEVGFRIPDAGGSSVSYVLALDDRYTLANDYVKKR